MQQQGAGFGFGELLELLLLFWLNRLSARLDRPSTTTLHSIAGAAAPGPFGAPGFPVQQQQAAFPAAQFGGGQPAGWPAAGGQAAFPAGQLSAGAAPFQPAGGAAPFGQQQPAGLFASAGGAPGGQAFAQQAPPAFGQQAFPFGAAGGAAGGLDR